MSRGGNNPLNGEIDYQIDNLRIKMDDPRTDVTFILELLLISTQFNEISLTYKIGFYILA